MSVTPVSSSRPLLQEYQLNVLPEGEEFLKLKLGKYHKLSKFG
jgi:hypothetical protein